MWLKKLIVSLVFFSPSLLFGQESQQSSQSTSPEPEVYFQISNTQVTNLEQAAISSAKENSELRLNLERLMKLSGQDLITISYLQETLQEKDLRIKDLETLSKNWEQIISDSEKKSSNINSALTTAQSSLKTALSALEESEIARKKSDELLVKLENQVRSRTLDLVLFGAGGLAIGFLAGYLVGHFAK